MLVTTGTANKLIADVWFARADFAKDHPDKIEAIVRGIFDAMIDLKDQTKKQETARLMGELYGIPASECLNMFADAHNTNWAENYQFFLNQNNPTNFERVWRQAYYLYRSVGAITHQPVSFDQVMDFSVIEKLGKEKKYSSQTNEYKITLAPKAVTQIKAESDEILTNTVVIHFYPNSWDLKKTVTKDVDGKTIEELYDPSVDLVLEEIAKLTEQFGAARVIIEGHTDASMRGAVPASLVKELSSNRANAVKEALVEKFSLDPNKFSAEGMGWDVPADADDPENHAKNRRVEIKVYSAEKG
jgi:outer membrane protein OmpA-like peptidoglycan-associated protein